MRTRRWLESDWNYARNLVDAGVDGFASGWKRAAEPRLTASKTSLWIPLAVGAAIGAIGGSLRTRRQRRGAALGGLLGGVLGFGGSLAWASRGFTGSVVRSTAQQINAARDAHWLEKNPVAYG